MDCCKYGEYRGPAHVQYGAGAGAGWDGYGYAPLPYPPYAHAYYAPPTHDPYGRYYRYDYPTHHMHHADHAMPMDYGGYALKEARSRRALARREQRSQPPAHLPLPHTPPLECGMNNRGPAYCEPQMWPHYQMGVIGGGGWNNANPVSGTWASRAMCSREPIRYNSDCRLMKGAPNLQNPANTQNTRTASFPAFEESSYSPENGGGMKHANVNEYPTREVMPEDNVQPVHERFFEQREAQQSPPEEKRPPVVPLPAFQQAFGSTEIGKFAEAFSRAEAVHDAEDNSNDNFVYDSFQDWDGPPELQWSSQSKEIKCEDNY